jgi:Holliday junction resolvase-like predicted endonuclease
MKSTGTAAEDLALQFLESRGRSLITRNDCSRFGEIDLVRQDVIAEVRLRNPKGSAPPRQA